MADNRVAYGLAKKYGIDTSGMSPKEVWEALKKKGVTEENISNGAYDSKISKHSKRIDKKPEINNIHKNFGELKKVIQKYNIKSIEVKPLKETLTEKDIIQRVAGGDKTKGSCSSVALAYIGNKAGLDVLDFRGGDSREIFANRQTIKELANLEGVKSYSFESGNDFTIAKELVSKMEISREYYFCVGDHAAIIRKTENKFEYLELQDVSKNGYYLLDNNVLKKRFGCKKSKTLYGKSYKTAGYLIDVKSLGNNKQFNELLSYINTNKGNQNKGDTGNVK